MSRLLDKSFRYIPARDHSDTFSFRMRQQERVKQAQAEREQQDKVVRPIKQQRKGAK